MRSYCLQAFPKPLGGCQIIKGIGANECNREYQQKQPNQTKKTPTKQIKGNKVRKLVNFQLILMNRC